MRKYLLAILGCGAALGAEFVTVSVQENRSIGQGSVAYVSAGNLYSVRNVYLGTLIADAYANLSSRGYQIAGIPLWANETRWDITAKADRDLTADTVRPYLRSLLAERFKLKIRLDTTEGPVYRLLAADGGARARASAGEVQRVQSSPGLILAQGLTMRRFADALGTQLGRRVIDNTGMPGDFDLGLKWASPEDPNGPSIFTALEEQLGLRLEPGTGPVESVVVEHIERPNGN